MKKTFRLTKGKHAPARVIDAIKADLNKHIKRERAKEIPEGVDYWDFECNIGSSLETAKKIHITAIAKAIDDAAAASTTESIYVEIITTGKRRNPSKSKPNSTRSAEAAASTPSVSKENTSRSMKAPSQQNPDPKSVWYRKKKVVAYQKGKPKKDG